MADQESKPELEQEQAGLPVETLPAEQDSKAQTRYTAGPTTATHKKDWTIKIG